MGIFGIFGNNKKKQRVRKEERSREHKDWDYAKKVLEKAGMTDDQHKEAEQAFENKRKKIMEKIEKRDPKEAGKEIEIHFREYANDLEENRTDLRLDAVKLAERVGLYMGSVRAYVVLADGNMDDKQVDKAKKEHLRYTEEFKQISKETKYLEAWVKRLKKAHKNLSKPLKDLLRDFQYHWV